MVNYIKNIFVTIKLVEPCHFLLKCIYQARKSTIDFDSLYYFSIEFFKCSVFVVFFFVFPYVSIYREKNPFAFTVLVGEHDRAYTEGTEILEKVDTLYIHRNFDVQTFKNDVALLKLGHPVDASSLYVRPACLPDNSTDFDDMICTITGWGANHNGENI